MQLFRTKLKYVAITSVITNIKRITRKIGVRNLTFQLIMFAIKTKGYIDKIKRQNCYKKRIALRNLTLKNRFRTLGNTVKHDKQKKKKNIKKKKGKLISKSNELLTKK